MYALPLRLQSVLDAAPHTASIVADVGCDHGMLAAALAQRSDKVFACDASELSLHGKAAKMCQPYGNVVLRHGDGLTSLTAADSVDTIFMAGLGVPKIIEMLQVGLQSIDDEDAARPRHRHLRTLVLQPMAPRLAYMAALRSTLAYYGFDICAETFLAVSDDHCCRPYLTLTATRRPNLAHGAVEACARAGRARPRSKRDAGFAARTRARLLGPAPELHADADAFRGYVHHQREWLSMELDGLLRAVGGGSTRSGAARLRRRQRRHHAWIETADEFLRDSSSNLPGTRSDPPAPMSRTPHRRMVL
jgi:tRNA A22 N-methylase